MNGAKHIYSFHLSKWFILQVFRMTNISKQIEVNNYVIEIITEIIYHNCYVSYDLILTILLERYDVISFEQLQCGSIFEIQSLSLVFELNKKVKRH
jgi:hypothetical protein